VDLIGTKGSGATPVRITLYRRAAADKAYLAGKRLVIWCLSAREFTEAFQGWMKVPVAP
jgi:alginate O-acetyltransferase complex protein AlgJ